MLCFVVWALLNSFPLLCYCSSLTNILVFFQFLWISHQGGHLFLSILIVLEERKHLISLWNLKAKLEQN